MSIFTWIKALLQDAWVKALINSILNALKRTVATVGKEALEKIVTKIKEAATHPTMSNGDKFLTVLAYAKTLVPGISESALRFLIESLVQDLKSNGSI